MTLSALLLGNQVLHALYPLAETPLYAQLDVFGDRLLNDFNGVAYLHTLSYDHISRTFADLTKQHGIPTFIKHVSLPGVTASQPNCGWEVTIASKG